jgi:tetratricopeptide (TPR) repeat protein
MEYVKGVPINQHCDTHRLDTRQRLELFRQVCEGVQHAHQKAIIHRDLKPTNVLVTEQDGRRLPKIIDFGVAKATAQKLTEKTMFTELGVLIGTPEYMSPEQAELTGEDVDTRTDVYSLGVILYELLVGALPFDPKELRSGGLEGIRKKIREEEPHKPSTRLSTLGDQSTESAKSRRVDLPTLQRQLRGDLDWITMRALEKDRSRRYGSPMDLAADIERYLSDQPVLASPPSAMYRATKFVRRHTAGVVAAAAGLVVLVAFAGTMVVQANRIAAERDRANAEAERANREAEAKGQVAEFLKDLFTVSDPGEARGNSITARELLDKGAEKIEQLEDEVTRAELMATMGFVYYNLGLYPQAEPLLEQGLDIQKGLFGDDHPDTLRSMGNLASLYQDQSRYDEAEPLYRQTLETRKRVLGDDHPRTLTSMNDLANLYENQGRYDEAEPLYLEVLEGRRRVLGDDHPETLISMNGVAMLHEIRGRYDQAEALHLETLEIRKRVLGDDHPDMLSSLNNLALVYNRQGRYDEAEPLYRQTLETAKRVLGDDHVKTLIVMGNLGNLYSKMNRPRDAEALLAEAVAGAGRALPREHDVTGGTIRKYGVSLKALERYDEAEAKLLEAHEILVAAVGADHPQTQKVIPNLVDLYEAWGKPDKAAEWRAKLPPEE